MSPAAEPARLDAVRRRLSREREARREAEAIAERVTAELYARSEELAELNQALRDFVAIASHDLRGPLAGILGMSALLCKRWEDVTPDRRIDALRSIHRQAEFMARLIDDLLTVSRIEAGALNATPEEVALHEAIGTIVADLPTPHPTVRVEAADVTAYVDPEHFRRILGNYLGNALKYGEAPFSAEARAAGDWAEVTVRDEGSGVPEELVPRLFGKFARAARSEERGGSGLGLSIVAGLAEANAGETWYEPNEPRGACFGIRLPLAL